MQNRIRILAGGARAFLSVAAALSLGLLPACEGPGMVVPVIHDDGDPPMNELRTLTLDTYDGSGQTVHPDFVRFASAAGTFGTLAITPYPNGNATRENPSIFGGETAELWSVPDGVANPIVRPREGYLSDPDIVRDPDTGLLRLYFREVASRNVIRLTTSDDAVHWSTPVTVTEGANHTILSPTVVRRGAGEWLMWAVDGNVGCTGSTTAVTLRRSADGITWSAPEPVSLTQPGVYPWHIEVQWIPSREEYWAVFNGKTAGSCTTPAVWLATSTDGVRWTTYPSPLLARGASHDFEDVVYRTTFDYDAESDVITFWYSGARYDGSAYIWKTAVQRRRRSEVFGVVTARAALAADALAPRVGVPPLLEAP